MIRWLIFIAIFFLVDFYAFQSVKTLSKNRYIQIVYWLVSIAVMGFFFYKINNRRSGSGLDAMLMLSFGLIVLIYVPKLLTAVGMLVEDFYRMGKWVMGTFSSSEDKVFFPERRAFVSKVGIGIAAIPFASILYGLMRGKYNYQVIKHTLYFDDLPEAFDGFKLTHLSDIHSGSFDNADKIAYGIDLINEQESDVILFTGDIVNNTADEMEPWIPYFERLKAKEGKYAVLGNHDYGEYVRWETSEDKEQNFNAIKNIHPRIGFNLLLNDSVHLERSDERIALIGVENWGRRFKQAGDLKKASEKVNDDDFKIVMSHDPTHWEDEIKDHQNNYHLTLSGHTHGMQFGIEIPGIRWSPVQYVYKYWAGIYKEVNRYINVNRGFGFLAFPGRVGIWPEITVITLKKR